MVLAVTDAFAPMVTVTFKGAPEEGEKLIVIPDQAYVSYVKASSGKSVLGAFGDAAMQLEGGSTFIAHSLTFEAIALAFVVGLACVFARRRRKAVTDSLPLLPFAASRPAT